MKMTDLINSYDVVLVDEHPTALTMDFFVWT
jgi:hypothetical protein